MYVVVIAQSGSITAKADSFNTEKQISPVVFYGSPHGVPPKRPTRLLLRLLHEIRVDQAEQCKSSLRCLRSSASYGELHSILIDVTHLHFCLFQ